MTIINKEALQDRALELEAKGYNGLKLALVRLPVGPNPTEAYLEVHFYNTNGVADIRNAISTDPVLGKRIFSITGGLRVVAGYGEEQVKTTGVTAVTGDDYLELIVSPLGDYSTYTLSLDTADIAFKNIDPLFSELNFKFRPGCFNLDCAPAWEKKERPKVNPKINYLAKDYESFRHMFIAGMMDRVPNWQPTSEADLDMMLLELFSVGADELSDFQDRVMSEAYLSSARKRVSLARHARLMDYHIHQGQQAGTVLAVKLTAGQFFTGEELFPVFPARFLIWSGTDTVNTQSQVFISQKNYCLHALLNQLTLYTWENAKPALSAGSTSAEVIIAYESGAEPTTAEKQADAEIVRDLIRTGQITRWLIQEWLNPETGKEAGRNPDKRQVLRLLPGVENCEVLQDPMTEAWYIKINWDQKDQLKYNYCFTIQCPDGEKQNITSFHGNLLDVYHGISQTQVFKAPGTQLADEGEYYFEFTKRHGTLCKLEISSPLAYQKTPAGNEIPPESTLQVSITNSDSREWEEVISLVHSQDSDEHYMVETDEKGQSWIRFGNGVNGKPIALENEITCEFQVGQGRDGNIGRDKLTYFEAADFPEIQTCWNPFDITDGLDPEPVAEIIRRVQEAYLYRQLRAVTEEDYVVRAEELPEVAKAAAKYRWTGSWRTVRLSLDPVGGTELSLQTQQKIAKHLNAVRLIGEDVELRLPKYVPVVITIKLCLDPDFWPEDIHSSLEQEFSDGYTPDGRQGFFHPDAWTFGRHLYASRILGRIQNIHGVEHVISVDMQRWNESTPGEAKPGVIEVRENEIILVKNDPDHMETGSIDFDVKGGRR